ncbi:MAG: HNH endonuclease, partial [Candidatus Latescibacterota bacterium]
KDSVFTRDGGRCTYIGTNGKRCNSTWGLEIDHIEPHARGGANAANNLRLLCGRHNRLEAERVMGVGITARRGRNRSAAIEHRQD